MAMPSGIATINARTVPTSTRNQARADMHEQRAVLDPFNPGLSYRTEGGEEARVDVEIGDQDGPEHKQHGEGQQKQQRRGQLLPKPHCERYCQILIGRPAGHGTY